MKRLAAIALVLTTLAAQSRPGIFRIQPVRPVAELRAAAIKLKPPEERGDFRKSDLVELAPLDPRIKLDIRYATADNFLSTPVYSSARAFLQRPAAEALLRAHRELIKQGYGILVFDAYRPWYVTKIFWDATPPDKHEFVANPAEGSRHNRGCAADISIYDLKTGREIEMPGVYDEMSERSYPRYTGGTAGQRERRDLLRREMEKQGFSVNPSEWWHFDYRDWKEYGIQNVPFEQLGAAR
jgi:zinc D-Ala-D-Ala dipeptidase